MVNYKHTPAKTTVTYKTIISSAQHRTITLLDHAHGLKFYRFHLVIKQSLDYIYTQHLTAVDVIVDTSERSLRMSVHIIPRQEKKVAGSANTDRKSRYCSALNPGRPINIFEFDSDNKTPLRPYI